MRRLFRVKRLAEKEIDFKKGDYIKVLGGFYANEGPNLYRPVDEESTGLFVSSDPEKETFRVFVSALNREIEVPEDKIKKLNKAE